MNSPRGAIKLWCLLTIFLLFGCTKPAFNIQTTFTEDELAPYANNGTATVVGQAFLKTQGGNVKYAAGNKITLMPVTSYTTEIVTAATSENYSKMKTLTQGLVNIGEILWQTAKDDLYLMIYLLAIIMF